MEPKELGRLGEGAAARYLQARGWRVLGRNVRLGRRELDLIVQRGKILAFVEVKSRVGIGFGDPLEAIDARKRVEVARAAAAWLRDRPPGGWSVIRFDAVGVLWSGPGRIRITHVPDAWRME